MSWISDSAILIGTSGGAASAVTAAVGYHQQSRGLRAETDVRLVRAFADLVPLANGRGPVHLSEAAAAKLAEGTYSSDDERDKALGAALLTSPVGKQTQVAVMRAIATLGCEHKVLWDAARAAVEEGPIEGDQRAHALARLDAHKPRTWRLNKHR